jgi:hypothetical protein
MSHRKMRVPKMDNPDGRMLETGLLLGKSALSCRNHDGKGAGAEGRLLLRRPTAVENTTAQGPNTREQGEGANG